MLGCFTRWFMPRPADPCIRECWLDAQAFMPVEQIIEHNLGQLFGGAIIKVRCSRLLRRD